MRVVLEASPLLHPLTGIGRYTWELANGLASHPDISSVSYLVRDRIINDVNKIQISGSRTKNFPLWSKPVRVAKNWIFAQRTKKRITSSLVHGPNYFLPRYVENGVVTVHDLSIFRYPETHPAERIVQFEKHFLDSLNRSQHIITDSEHMRKEIIDSLSWAPDRISTVLLGVTENYVPIKETNHTFLQRFFLKVNGYTLCVSTIEPRKNIDKLLKAYRLLPNALRMRYPLVLVGGYGWLASDVIPLINQGTQEGWLIHIGFIVETDLINCYTHARLFVYPSAYEGFGLPVAEAMACGVPVIISNRSCLTEVSGGAAMVIDPDDIVAFAVGIRQGLEDEQWRIASKAKGLLVSTRYSWSKCVEDTVSVYKKLNLSQGTV